MNYCEQFEIVGAIDNVVTIARASGIRRWNFLRKKSGMAAAGSAKHGDSTPRRWYDTQS